MCSYRSRARVCVCVCSSVRAYVCVCVRVSVSLCVGARVQVLCGVELIIKTQTPVIPTITTDKINRLLIFFCRFRPRNSCPPNAFLGCHGDSCARANVHYRQSSALSDGIVVVRPSCIPSDGWKTVSLSSGIEKEMHSFCSPLDLQVTLLIAKPA